MPRSSKDEQLTAQVGAQRHPTTKKTPDIQLPFGFKVNSGIPSIHQGKSNLPPPSEEISFLPRQDPPASAPQLPMSTLATARATRTAAAHSKPPLEVISLPPQRDLQVRGKDTSLAPMEEISLLPRQKSASAPQLPTLMILACLGQTHEVLKTDLRAKHQS